MKDLLAIDQAFKQCQIDDFGPPLSTVDACTSSHRTWESSVVLNKWRLAGLGALNLTME